MNRSQRASLAVLALLVLLNGCAPAGAPRPAAKVDGRSRAAAVHGELPTWRMEELAQAETPLLRLRGTGGTSFIANAAWIRSIRNVATKVMAAAGNGEMPELLVVGTATANAFAAYDDKRPVIAITIGMVQLLQADEDAWAALIGHELAHFRLGHHVAAEHRKETVGLGTSLAGLVLSAAGLGFGSLAADATGTLMERAFSRDDERAADAASVDYVRRAGFDPRGALRLQERLLAADSSSPLGFLRTHPSGSERIEAIKHLIGENEHSMTDRVRARN